MRDIAGRGSDLQAVGMALAETLGGKVRPPGSPDVVILSREPVLRSSSFSVECITCRSVDGRELRYFCKHGEGSTSGNTHRNGIAYEAAVYRHVLAAAGAEAAAFCGAFSDAASGATWLVLEYLDGAVRVGESPDPSWAMQQAARWIGQFHATTEPLSSSFRHVLRPYDVDYFAGWTRRTLAFSTGLLRRYAWLPETCEAFERLSGLLCAPPRPVIHGEFEADNVLVGGCRVYPVDWESAAIAAGEIDLASLTWGWDSEIVRACEAAYAQARWPGGAPAEFERRLALARMYLPLRWLGDRPEWTTADDWAIRFTELRTAATRLGLVCGP